MKATFDAKKAVAEAELRNEKLARLLGVEEVKNRQLQESLKRFSISEFRLVSSESLMCLHN